MDATPFGAQRGNYRCAVPQFAVSCLWCFVGWNMVKPSDLMFKFWYPGLWFGPFSSVRSTRNTWMLSSRRWGKHCPHQRRYVVVTCYNLPCSLMTSLLELQVNGSRKSITLSWQKHGGLAGAFGGPGLLEWGFLGSPKKCGAYQQQKK